MSNCPVCGSSDYDCSSDFGCAVEQQMQPPMTIEEECQVRGHEFAGIDCGKPRCYCGERYGWDQFSALVDAPWRAA